VAGFIDWTPPRFSPASIPTLPSLTLSEDEQRLIGYLQTKCTGDRPNMVLTKSYYRAAQRIDNLKIAITDELAQQLRTLVGWARIPVDPYVERLHIEGFRLPGETDVNETLAEIWAASGMDAEFPLATKDALSMGRGYFLVGSAAEAGDPPRITVESPLSMAVDWDVTGRRPKAALQTYTEDERTRAALYLPDRTIFIGQNERQEWELVDIDVHHFGYVPIHRMANDEDSDNRNGYSEITPSLMSIIDSACRRLMGLEVASELYSVPRELILGASTDDFQNPDGKARKAWDAYISKVRLLERDEEGNLPEFKQTMAYDPATFTKVIEMYAAQAAGESRALPQELGLYTDGNPISIESLNAMDTMRNRRAILKQRTFGVPVVEVAQTCMRFLNNGVLPREFRRIAADWAPPEMASLAQLADPLSKLIAAGTLPATSDVTLKRASFSAVERAQIEQDRGPQRADQIVATLQANAKAAQPPAPTSPEVNGGDTAAAGG
jgi:hypothetical protein